MAQMGRERPMNRRTPPRGRAGFTLIEIMLALGVLGVGMIMVAAISPAAIYQTRAADRATHAVLICDNARATLQLKATDSAMVATGTPDLNVNTEFAPVEIDDPARNPGASEPDILPHIVVHAEDARYPTGPLVADVNDRQGWVALTRRRTAGTTGHYQFVVIAYRKFEGMGYTEADGGHNVIDQDLDEWDEGETWCDGRGRPALVRISDEPWPASLGEPSVEIEDVTITQVDDPDDDYPGCLIWIEVEDNAHAKEFLSVGSPVILDGRNTADGASWGRFRTIVEIWEGTHYRPDDNTECWVVRLSGDLLDENDESPLGTEPLRERGIWVMPGAGFRTPSPAIGAASFRMVLPN